MAVYMIRAGEVGPMKIGHSADPAIRLVNLQTAHYEILRIVRLFHGGEPEERFLHSRFSDLEIRGEWYAFSKLMMGDVGLEEIPLPSTIVVEPIIASITFDTRAVEFCSELRAMRRSRALTQRTVSEAMGISRSHLAMIETGSDLPGRDLLLKFASFYRVPSFLASDAA